MIIKRISHDVIDDVASSHTSRSSVHDALPHDLVLVAADPVVIVAVVLKLQCSP